MSKLRDALGGCDRASLVMHLKAILERVWWCTRSPLSSELRDALEGHNPASMEMHLQAELKLTQRCTLSPWSRKLGVEHRVYHQERMKECLEKVDTRRAGCCDSMHQLVNSQPWECDKLTWHLSSHVELAGGGGSWREAHRKLKLPAGFN
jgi:hypothetical protein